MATTCNLGQIKDLRIRSLCLGKKTVIDASRNVDARNIVATNIKSRCNLRVNKDAVICGNLIVKGGFLGGGSGQFGERFLILVL